MKSKTIALGLVSLIFLSGCSNKQLYEAIQQNRQQECNLLPVEQYDDCMELYEESYDAYKKLLDEAANQ